MINKNYASVGWYEPWEFVVNSWDDLIRVADFVVDTESHNFYWRGQADARWALASSLHRQMQKGNLDGRAHVIESDISMEELRIKIAAQMEWRMEDTEDADFFLKLQHMGLPTRLIDVTKSPIIAAWFACEDPEFKSKDGRLFAFGLDPNTFGKPEALRINTKWPFNKHWADNEETLTKDNEFFCWEPRFNLDPNILAQQSAFILGHTPSNRDYRVRGYKKLPGHTKETWSPSSVLRSTSLHINFTEAWKRIDGAWGERSAYTIRIKSKAKDEIVRKARRIAGVTDSTLFPNIEGFKRRLEARGRDPFRLIYDRMFDLD